MKVTHHGHSCLLVEAAGQRLLIDPGVFSDFGGITELDAVLVTHQHPDHLDHDRLLGLVERNPKARVLAEPAAAAAAAATLEEASKHVEALEGDALRFGDLEVSVLPGPHAHIHDYVPRIDNCGLVLQAPGEPRLFHPGDSLTAEPEAVDYLCVPVNAPWGRIHDMVEFVRRIQPTQGVIPIHDGLLKDKGRGMYLGHITQFGSPDGAVTLHDLRDEGATELTGG